LDYLGFGLMMDLNEIIQSDKIKNIELTELGKKPMRKVDFVHGEKRVEILHNPVRLMILQILRDGVEDALTEESYDKETQVLLTKRRTIRRQAMSVLEIIRMSRELKSDGALTKNQIYHHLPLLEEGGFVVKHGTVTTGKRTTDYYRRTAESFVTYGLHHDPKKYSTTIRKDIDDALPMFDFELNEKEKKELSNLLADAEVMRLKWAPIIESLVTDDIASNKPIEMFDKLLWIYSTGQDDFLNTLDRIRSLIFKET
jgi:DNA-binding transcriptional ArsR family regulator